MATYLEIQTRINNKLSEYKQLLRIEVYTKTKCIISNKIEFQGLPLIKFKKRLTVSKSNIWYEYFDKWINNEITEKDIFRMMAIHRGQKCQAMHSHIKQNLNQGIPWIKGKKLNIDYQRKPLTAEQCQKMSIQRMGSGNPMFGKKHTKSYKEQHSDLMKTLIKEGKFTPNNNNRQTHYDVMFNGKKYRSSWEALYQYFNPQAEYEKLRLSYFYNKKERVYIVDFIDYVNKLVVEVKPVELTKTTLFTNKWSSLVEWACANSYNVLLADQHWLVNNIPQPDLTVFDDNTARKVQSLYETSKKN